MDGHVDVLAPCPNVCRPKCGTKFGRLLHGVRKMLHISDMALMTARPQDAVWDRIHAAPYAVWTPNDFADIANREAVDKALQRLTAAGHLRRIGRGLYDRPRFNKLTGQPTAADYRAVIDAVSRRDQVRVLVDGMTAANDLGLTTAVPAKIDVWVDARLKPIRLGNQEIRFRTAAPSKLFWAGRPAMRVVQAVYWLQDALGNVDERDRITSTLRTLFENRTHGRAIRADIRAGLSALPIWMQEFLRELTAGAAVRPRSQAKTGPKSDATTGTRTAKGRSA